MSHFAESVLSDPSRHALLASYVAHASERMAGTRFDAMLTPECQAQVMDEFATLLVSHAHDSLNSLVAQVLAEQNWLWGLNTALAPSKNLESARSVVAAHIEASGGTIVDDTAPLLRTELQRQTDRFVETTIELLERIWRDRGLIASELLNKDADAGLGRIHDLNMRQADFHNGGRRTTIVTCEAGRFVYKPHSCAIDLWFYNMARKYVPESLRQPRTIVRHDKTGHWGFAEFIEHQPVATEVGIAQYWRNFGRAAALFDTLGSEDLHNENFVASGEAPSLIDVETVLTGEATHQGDPLTCPNLRYASQGFAQDLDRTLTLSCLMPNRTKDGQSISPLYAEHSSSLPVWNGHEYDVRGYEDDFLAGFDEALARLAKRIPELEEDMRATEHMPTRRILRSTNVYATLLFRLCKRDAYEPAKRHELLQILHRALVHGQTGAKSPLATCEIASLLAGDVPYLVVEAGSRSIMGVDGATDDQLLAASAKERAISRIRTLDEPHRAFSHAVLEANLRRALIDIDNPLPQLASAEAPLSTTRALEEALDVFWRLEQLVILSPSGESSWLFRSSYGELISWNVEFGNGLGGMAVFLAALASRVSDGELRSRAIVHLQDCVGSIEEIIACLEIARTIPEQSIGLGITDGLGGTLRTLDLVVRSLEGQSELSELRHRAQSLLRRLLALLPRADIAHVEHADVYSGLAGLLLALGECHMARHDANIRALAQRLVDRLMDLRAIGTDKNLCDTCNTGWPVSGFGHGQAGIAAALAQTAHVWGIDVGTAADDALSFERSIYNKRIGTWPDLRQSPASDTHLDGICSGAPGVGLAALMVAEGLGEEAPDAPLRDLAQQLISLADDACASIPPRQRDTLCCGSLSVVEYLLARGKREEAGCLLAGIVDRKQALGCYALNGAKMRQTDEPSFLWGLAGIGYVLLRYADPSLAPVF